MDTITFGKSSFECSDVRINTPQPTVPDDTVSFEISFSADVMALPADHHFAIYADGKHVGDLHDAILEGNTLRGLFVHA